MKFTALALASLLSLTSAAPTPAAEKRWTSDSSIIKPTYISVYNRNTGGLTYNPAHGSSIFDKTTTISTFNVPSTLAGSKCRLGFYIDPLDTVATLTPATGVQIFSSLQAPPTYDVPSWGPPGNQRDIQYGNLKIAKPGEAVVDDWPRLLQEFDCKTGVVSFEVNAVWNVGVEWDASLSGLYVAKV